MESNDESQAISDILIEVTEEVKSDVMLMSPEVITNAAPVIIDFKVIKTMDSSIKKMIERLSKIVMMVPVTSKLDMIEIRFSASIRMSNIVKILFRDELEIQMNFLNKMLIDKIMWLDNNAFSFLLINTRVFNIIRKEKEMENILAKSNTEILNNLEIIMNDEITKLIDLLRSKVDKVTMMFVEMMMTEYLMYDLAKMLSSLIININLNISATNHEKVVILLMLEIINEELKLILFAVRDKLIMFKLGIFNFTCIKMRVNNINTLVVEMLSIT